MDTDTSTALNTSIIYLNDTVLNETEISKEVPEAPVYIVVISSIFYVLIFVIGLFGNVVVILVVMCNRNMKTPVNVYLINLCVADILVLVVCMPTALVDLYSKDYWYFGEAMCFIVPFVELVVAGSSIFTIMAITIERYRVVYKPLNWKGITPSQVLKIIIIIWICALGLSAPVLSIIRYRDSNLVDGTPIKVCRLPVREKWHRAYIILMSVVVYVLPCVILFVLYFRVCRTLMPSRDSTLDGIESTYREKRRLRGQVINIISTVVVVFFLCHLPFRVISLWVIFANKMEMHKLGLERFLNLLYSARILFYINHALNPILYNFVSKKFRTAFWWLWKTKCSSARDRERESRISQRGFRLADTAKTNNHMVTFRPGDSKSKQWNCVRPNKSTQSSTCSTGEKINDFSFIYKKISNKEGKWGEGMPEPNTKKRVATVHLKVHSSGFYITMKQGENNNSGGIGIPLNNMASS